MIQNKAAMHFRDEVGHVVHKSPVEDFAHRSVDGVKPGFRGSFEDQESPITHEKLGHPSTDLGVRIHLNPILNEKAVRPVYDG